MNYATDFKSIRDEVSRRRVADQARSRGVLSAGRFYGMTDLIYNHITARIPGTGHLLINLYGLIYKEITASSLVKIDIEGNIIAKPDTDYGINNSGYVIHGAIHKARPDVACVLHTHTRAGMAVSAMKCGLLPLSQTAMRFAGHIGYHDYEGPAIESDERARLVRDLGPHDAMIMRSRAPHLRRDHPAGLQHDVPARTVMPLAGRCDGGAYRIDLPCENVLRAYRASLSARHAPALWRPGMAGDAAAARRAGASSGFPPYWQ